MCTRHKQHPQGVALQATCTQPKAGQDRHRRWVPRCLRQDRPKGERLAASPLRGYAATLSQRGSSLIELIMFIVIVSVALAGILLVMNVTTKNSADPLVHKQALAIAESLLEEVELMPFTYCDPNDPAATTATGAAGCTGGAAASQDLNGSTALTIPNTPIPAGESRGNAANPFDNVADYGGYNMNGITDITGAAIAGLASYQANVALTRIGTTFMGGAAVAGDALLITVTITGPDNLPVVVEGIRTRYSPKAVP